MSQPLLTRWLVSTLLTATGCLVACSVSPATAPIVSGGPQPPVAIGVRNAHAMAYDPNRGEVLLYGGADENQVRGDLWARRNGRWIELAAGGPPPRTFPVLAFDEARRKLVLFGGNRVLFGPAPAEDTSFLADHWEWDGSWQQRQVQTPGPRAEAAYAYDRARQRVVLFGGYHRTAGAKVTLGDTWEWDGTTWQEVATIGPAPRNGATMTYDASRQQVVLFGGNGRKDDTWQWDGKLWTQVHGSEVEGLFDSEMADHEHNDEIVRFGGWNGEQRVDETLTFDGRGWRSARRSGPSARNHSAVVYDPSRRVVLLFGGHDGTQVFGDTWEWNGRRWRLVEAQEPRPRSDNGH